MNKETAKQQELQRRKKLRENILQLCYDKKHGQWFQQQRDYILDKSKRKALFLPRRGGKSGAIAIEMLYYALVIPNIKILYFGLTKYTAKNTILEQLLMPMLKRLGYEYEKHYTWNVSNRELRFLNNSVIILTGADKDEQETNKWLGGKYFGCWIDECQDQSKDLFRIIVYKLQPAVKDYLPQGGGMINCSGTPGNHMGDHYWYKMTRQDGIREVGWQVHEWGRLDNPFNREADPIEMIELEKNHGENFRTTDWFLQQYESKWITSDRALVYRFNPKCLIDKLPELIRDPVLVNQPQYQYFLGIDLGYEDENAWTIWAQHVNDPNAYLVDSIAENHMDYHQIAKRTVDLNNKYHFLSIVIDTGGGGKTTAETIRKEFQLPTEDAKKLGKEGNVERINSYFHNERIKVIETPGTLKLIEEMQMLRKDHRATEQGYFKEAEKYKNHRTDSMLYGFNKTYPYLSIAKTPLPPNIKPHSDFFYQVQRQDRIRDNQLKKHAGKWQQMVFNKG